MPLHSADKKFHEGTLIVDDWVPVVVGTNISPPTAICLRFGVGGGNVVVETHRQDRLGETDRTIVGILNGEVLNGRFKRVVSATGTVADIHAGIID